MKSFCCFSTERQACNYYCKVCKSSGGVPNILGRFIILDNKNIFCTGCKSEFPKDELNKFTDFEVVYVERKLF